MFVKEPFVSVCIATYNRSAYLIETIKCLVNQKYSNYEIIVANQNNNDSDIKKHIKKLNCNIRHYFLKKISLTYARNFCISQAKGEIIIFVDDDVIIEPNFIYHHTKNYYETKIEAVVGMVIEPDTKGYSNKKANIFTFYGRPYLNLRSNIRSDVLGGKGCNMSFRKQVFSCVGKFDEKIPKPFLREETDMFIRLKKHNKKVLYEPLAKVYHKQALEGGCRIDYINRVKINPSLNENYYICDTIFQLKHYNKYTFPLFIMYLTINFVLKYNYNNYNDIKQSFKCMRNGICKGIKYFHSWY